MLIHCQVLESRELGKLSACLQAAPDAVSVQAFRIITQPIGSMMDNLSVDQMCDHSPVGPGLGND